MGSPSRNVQYHPPRQSEDRLNLAQPHSPSLPTHCFGKSGMRPLHLLGRRDQRLRQRRRIAVGCILHRHRHHGPRVHVDPVLGLVSQVRPAVLHLRDLRVRVLRRFPVLVRRLLVLPRPVEPSQIRPRRGLHTGRFRQPPNERFVGFSRVPPLDAPHRRVHFQRRRIDDTGQRVVPQAEPDRLPPNQTRCGQPLQNPRGNRLVGLYVDPPPRARQRRVIRRRLRQLQVQERPQTQRIGHPPRNPPLRRL